MAVHWPDAPILVTGGTGFRTVIHSNSNGEFAMTLPYGQYRLFGGVQHGTERPPPLGLRGSARKPCALDLVIGRLGSNPRRATGRRRDTRHLDRCHERASLSRSVQPAGAAAEPGAVQCDRAARFHWPQRQPAGGRVAAGILLDRHAIQAPGHGCDRLLSAGTSGGLARRPGAR